MEPLLDLALLLFGGKMGGVLFSKIRQPSVVGEIIAGIILGPSLLALIRPSALVTSVADLGLLFLILLVSLSIDWKGLEGDTEKYVYVELTRAGIALGLTYVIGLAAAWDIFTTIAIGLVAVLSSTSIVSRALADFKQLGSAVGQALMGMEIVDEVVGIVAISLLANMVNGASFTFEPVLTTVFIVVGFLVVMKRVGVQFVNRAISSIQKYGIEEALLGFTLLLAFILGSLT
ncbi:MAG: cation:proton antiporter, partial [Candidatus Aenigmarchaeota archaeon]|nr:cation:proton antiporter [Candidatus Aenigmarchaeota archaeon]